MAEIKLTGVEVKQEIDNIKKLASDVEISSSELIETAARCIERGIQTEWAMALKDQLRQFQTVKVAEAIADIKKQADKLVTASEEAATFSQGEV